jgi:hypothetical protein
MNTLDFAFPFKWDDLKVYDTGMLLRDYFASSVIGGLAANDAVNLNAVDTDEVYRLADRLMESRVRTAGQRNGNI